MANVIIKSDERKAYEQRVMRSFGVERGSREQKEAAEVVAARSAEAYKELKRMEVSSRAPVWGASLLNNRVVVKVRVSSRAPVWGASSVTVSMGIGIKTSAISIPPFYPAHNTAYLA